MNSMSSLSTIELETVNRIESQKRVSWRYRNCAVLPGAWQVTKTVNKLSTVALNLPRHVTSYTELRTEAWMEGNWWKIEEEDVRRIRGLAVNAYESESSRGVGKQSTSWNRESQHVRLTYKRRIAPSLRRSVSSALDIKRSRGKSK